MNAMVRTNTPLRSKRSQNDRLKHNGEVSINTKARGRHARNYMLGSVRHTRHAIKTWWHPTHAVDDT